MKKRIPYRRLDVKDAICRNCLQWKPNVEFWYIAKDIAVCHLCHKIGRHCSRCRMFFLYKELSTHGYCHICAAQMRRDDYKKNGKTPETKRNERNWRLKRRFNLSQDEYDEMFARQMGLCAICGKAETFTGPKKHGKVPVLLAVDHCHTTGLVRELLCNRCNVMLGACQDNIDIMQKATAYLIKHSM